MVKAMRPFTRASRLINTRALCPKSFSTAANGSISTTQLRRQLPSHAVRCPTARLLPGIRAGALVQQNAARYASSTVVDPATLGKTQLYDLHISRGAKMVPFADFAMPLQYSDLSHVESHKWTREKASLFDVSHM